MEALGINLGFLLFQIFNFTFVLILLYAFAYRPIINMLEKRKKTIAQAVEDARIAAEARESAETDARTILTRAQSEAAAKVREATERAEAASRDVTAQAAAEGCPGARAHAG
jgi:F-type H+-transporting ATPase subunit b